MDFIVNNWLWFGGAALIILALAAINFLAGASSSLNMNRDGFARSVKLHLVFMVLWAATIIPFLIGAVVQIIHWVQHHG